MSKLAWRLGPIPFCDAIPKQGIAFCKFSLKVEPFFYEAYTRCWEFKLELEKIAETISWVDLGMDVEIIVELRPV